MHLKIIGNVLLSHCIFIYGFRYYSDELFAFFHTGRSIRDKDCNGIMAAIRQQHHSDIIDSDDPGISIYISCSCLVGDLRTLPEICPGILFRPVRQSDINFQT